jgi:hypothetical protein
MTGRFNRRSRCRRRGQQRLEYLGHQLGGRQRAAERVRAGRLLERNAGADGQHQLGQPCQHDRRRLPIVCADRRQHIGERLDGARMGGGVPAGQHRVPGGMHPELDHQQQPARRGLVAAGQVVHQRRQAAAGRQGLGEPGILRRAFRDPGLKQSQEQVGLALKLRVDHALGESRLLGDLLQRRAMVAARQEHPAGRVQHQSAIASDLLSPAQTFHTFGI